MDNRFKFTPENGFENVDSYPNPKGGSESRRQLMEPLYQLRDFINSLLPNLATSNEVDKKIRDAVFATNSADMHKAVYDKDNDGIVDEALKAKTADNAGYATTVDTDTEISSASTKPLQTKVIEAYLPHKLSGFTIAANSAWEAIEKQSWDPEGLYLFRYSKAIEGVLATDDVKLTLDVTTLSSGLLAPFGETYDGGIYLFASEIPGFDIICFELTRQKVII